MNTPAPNPEDAKLSALLKESHVPEGLPPRFQEGVWRRIQRQEAPAAAQPQSWFNRWAALWLRPQWVAALLALCLLAGTASGMRLGKERVKRLERARYLQSVNPLLN